MQNEDLKFKFISNYCSQTESLIKNLNKKYDSNFYESFKASINTFHSDLQIIKTKQSQLNELLGHKNQRRNKRGWFDFVGIISKNLFGIMDNEDAKFIDDKINEFDKSEHLLASLIKDQSQIVRSTILNFNNTISSIHKNSQVLKTNLDKIRSFLVDGEKETKMLDLQLVIEEHFLVLSHLVNGLKSDYDTLITSVLLVKRGTLHPSIISPFQLREHLLNASSTVPPGLELPISPNKDESFTLLDIIDIIAYFHNSKLVFVIKVPLLPVYYFEVYKLIPLPIKILKNTYTFIKPTKSLLAIRKDRQKFIMLEQPDLSKCKRFIQILLCIQHNPLFDIHANGVCETKLLMEQPIQLTQECDTRFTNMYGNLWLRLQNKNSWIYATQKQSTITINCKDNPSEIKNSFINGTGIVSLNEDCIAYSETTILEPSKIYTSTVERDFAPYFNMCETLCSDEKLHKINISNFNLRDNLNNVLNVNELHLASHKLEEIENLADNILITKTSENKINVMTYLVVIAVSIIAAYFIVRYLIRRFSENRCCRSICSSFCPPIVINNRINSTDIAIQQPQDIELTTVPRNPTNTPVTQHRYNTRHTSKLFSKD